jgi:isochorismate synthase
MTTLVHRHLTPLGRTPASAFQGAAIRSEFCWRDAASGLSFRAVGANLVVSDPSGPTSESAARSILFEHYPHDTATRPMSDSLPARLHALGFDPMGQVAPESPWKGWPRAASWLPEHLIATTGDGRSFAITHVADDVPRDEGERRRARFAEAASQALSAPRTDVPRREPALMTAVDELARAHFVERVERAKRSMATGALSKVVLARSETLRGAVRFDGEGQLQALAEAAPRAVVFGWRQGDHGTWLGATPEVLVRVSDGVVSTSAIAGTARRVEDPEGCALLRDAKCLHEHALVVAAMRDVLASLVTDLVVDERPRVLTSERLVHLETAMHGRLGAAPLLAIARALHPTPALGGSPREAALEWLHAHEGMDRGHYGAPLGWEAPNGDGVLAVGIRAALLKGSTAVLFAGAGLVEGSDPEAEWRETESKLELARSTLTPSPPKAEHATQSSAEEARA